MGGGAVKHILGLLPVRTWAILGVIVIVLLMLLSWRSACTAVETAKEQATIGDARTASAVDANKERDAADAREGAINDEVKDGTDAIRQAPDRDARRRARLRSLCNLDSSDPQCRVFDAPR
jgi:hypothetical protein